MSFQPLRDNLIRGPCDCVWMMGTPAYSSDQKKPYSIEDGKIFKIINHRMPPYGMVHWPEPFGVYCKETPRENEENSWNNFVIGRHHSEHHWIGADEPY